MVPVKLELVGIPLLLSLAPSVPDAELGALDVEVERLDGIHVRVATSILVRAVVDRLMRREALSDRPEGLVSVGHQGELGRFDEAFVAFRQVGDRIRDWPVSIAAWGLVSGIAGRPALARQALAELEELSSRRFVTSYGVALVHAGLHQSDAAFASLDTGFDERSNWLVWLRLDPRWNALRPDPRFAELVSRMRFPPNVD
jgi:hypothetical protein